MKLRMFVVDAFSSRVFGGNAAGVVPLEAWLPDGTMQTIAAENNQAETAFFVPATAPAAGTRGEGADYRLRWFAPTMEIDLCGHATLASAHVLARHLGRSGDRVRFASRSGLLEVARDGDRWALDFPARPGEPRPIDPALIGALGASPREVRVARDTMAVFDTEEQVRALRPDTAKVLALDAFGVIATAPGASGSGCDFVSRFFVPKAGIPEDPATGSSHCTLVPYWAARLGRTELHDRQLSARGGEFWCRHDAARGRVIIAGHAVTYLEGTATIG